MKYLNYIYFILWFSALSIYGQQQDHSAKLFDVLYPITPASYIKNNLMQTWEELRNLISLEQEADEYDYYVLIGHIQHIHDVILELIETNHPYIIPDHMLLHYIRVIEHMIDESGALQKQGRTLLYNRLIKELNELLYTIEWY